MLFAEIITIQRINSYGVAITYQTGGITISVNNAKVVNEVYSTTVPGGLLAVPVSVSGGNNFVMQLFHVPASSSLSAPSPLVELGSGATLPPSVSVIYDGF